MSDNLVATCWRACYKPVDKLRDFYVCKSNHQITVCANYVGSGNNKKAGNGWGSTTWKIKGELVLFVFFKVVVSLWIRQIPINCDHFVFHQVYPSFEGQVSVIFFRITTTGKYILPVRSVISTCDKQYKYCTIRTAYLLGLISISLPLLPMSFGSPCGDIMEMFLKWRWGL